MQPVNAISIPIILLLAILALKKITPVIITKTGVSALRVPARALSIFSSARQNKKAGNKLPRVPDKKTSKSFLAGIRLIYFTVIGNKIAPDDTIRKAATW